MNYRIIIFLMTLFLSSCSDEKKPSDDEHKNATTLTPNVKDAEQHITQEQASTPDIFSIKTLDLILGNKDAAITLIEYSSPTCPHCSYFHKEILPKIKEKYVDTGKISYILREFITNKQDLDAALLGRCYQDKLDPLKLMNLLYVQQDNWAFNKNYREILSNIGGLAGVTTEQYNKCLNNTTFINFLIENSRIISKSPGFVGTPAFFINGIMHQKAYSLEEISKAIDNEIHKND